MPSQAVAAPSASERPTTSREPAHEHGPVPSKAAIAGHPIHPMLIPFPIAFLSFVPVTDIAFAVTEATFWSSVSYYLLWAGVISAGVAMVFGLIDFASLAHARVRAGWVHLSLNVVVVVLAVANLLLRVGDTIANVIPSGLLLSLLAAALLLVSGWYGGELSYRHKVGVIDGG